MSQKVCSGHTVSVMTEEWVDKMEKEQTGYKRGMIKLLPDGWLVPTAYLDYEKGIFNFQIKSSDVFLMTMPKSGTTWTQEILWTMMNNPNLDNPMTNIHIMGRSPQIDLDMLFDSKADLADPSKGPPAQFQEIIKAYPKINPQNGIFLQLSEFISDPRLIKTHLPLALMPSDILDKAKVVYVARNPKDVVVSMFHHFRLLKIHNYTGSLEDFAKAFIDDDILYSPYWPHIKLAWKNRHHPNLHFMFFEDMKADISNELRKLNEFLGTGLTPEQLSNVEKHTSFKAMKERDAEILVEGKEDIMNKDVSNVTGGFFRKGQTGDWKNCFSAELTQKMNEWVETNASKIGITFK